MKLGSLKPAIVALIVFEALWALQPRKPGYPRSPETVQAEQIYKTTPSAETEARYIDQIRRDIAHNSRCRGITILALLIADVVLVYFFWNYGTTKAAVS